MKSGTSNPVALMLGVASLFLSTGCSTLGGVEAGPAYAVGKSDETAGVVNAYLGAAVGDRELSLGVGSELRTKIGPKVGQVALDPYFYGLFAVSEVVVPFVRAGFALLQFESVRDRFAFGMFSPHATAGVFFAVSGKIGLTVGFDAEYVARFTDTPDTGYLAFTAGVAEYHVSPPPRFTRARPEPLTAGRVIEPSR